MSIEYEDIAGWRLERKPFYTGTWAGKPAANAIPLYGKVRITDYGVGGFSDWYSNGTRYVRVPLVIYNNGLIDVSSVAVAETGLLTVGVKGGSPGPNGSLVWEFYTTHTNNAANRTMRLRIGVGAFTTSHTQMWQQNASTTTQSNGRMGFQNKNSEAAQIASAVPFQYGVGPTTGTPSEATIDTTADFNVSFSVVSDGTQSLTLKSSCVTLYPG